MAREPGHEPGHPPSAGPDAGPHAPPAGFGWGDYVEFLVARHGTLAAVAERLAALRGFRDDVASVERALRRLRTREQRDGGAWGARALAAFGLPDAVDARARWMGAYHSRFIDLPLALCEDLVRLWDRPPVSEAPGARAWLALAHATCALRAGDARAAATHLARARLGAAGAPAEARAEMLLAEAFTASHDEPARVVPLLARVEPLLGECAPGTPDRACLYARWIDQRAYEINRGRDGRAPDYAAAEALYHTIPAEGAPAFALCRRANGLAYARWKQGHPAEGARLAREAAEHAGDGGHLRLRAMALAMLARIDRGPDGAQAWRRALAIADALGDAALRARFERRARA